MIPILYDKDETLFIDTGLGRLTDCLSCVVTEERNGIYECAFEYPVDGYNYDLIKPGRIIYCWHDDGRSAEPFDIVGADRPINGIVTFHAVHVSYRLSGVTVNEPVRNINSLYTAIGVVQTLGVPANPFLFHTDKLDTQGYVACLDGTPRTVRQVLGGVEGSILDTFGGEYQFSHFNVNLLISRGEEKAFTIRYGTNLVDFNEEIDLQESFSSCIPFWKGQNDKGAEVTVVGAKVNYAEATQMGRDVCVPLDLTDKFENKPTTAQLQAEASAVMRSMEPTLPEQNIKVDFVSEELDEELYLCDTINVVFPAYGFKRKFKIVKTVYDALSERYTELELGTLSTTLSQALGMSETLGANTGFSGGDLEVNDLTVQGAINVTANGKTYNLVPGAYEYSVVDGWEVRKYANGTFEAWRNSDAGSTGAMTQVGTSGTYYSTPTQVAFPGIGITSVKECIPSVAPNANYLMQMGVNRITNSGAYFFYLRWGSGQAVSDLHWNVYLTGTWA